MTLFSQESLEASFLAPLPKLDNSSSLSSTSFSQIKLVASLYRYYQRSPEDLTTTISEL